MSPIYEYKCNKCGKIFEKLMPMQDDKADNKYMRCPCCQDIGVKIPSINHFILKGTGWSKDGYWKKK